MNKPTEAIQQWGQVALTDWVNLLQGPHCPPFREEGDVEPDFPVLLRLLALVLILINVISAPVTIASEGFRHLVEHNSTALLLLPIGAIIAVPYSFFVFPLFRVKMTFSKTFFTFLFLGLPWLPLWVLARSVGDLPHFPAKGFTVVILFYLIGFANIRNLCRGVSLVSRGPAWRVWVSLLIRPH
jgi:hypothetical protein